MNYMSKNMVAVLIVILIGSNIAWGVEYFSQKATLMKDEAELSGINQNKKILAFQKLFVEKVLKSSGAVDFNTRVELQNAAKDTGNEAVIQAWNGFLGARTEAEGQARVKELISTLASSVYVE